MAMTDNQQHLDEHARSAVFSERKQAALNPDIHPDTLARLVLDESLVIVGYVAGHPSTRPEDLMNAVHRAHDAIVELESARHPSRSLEEVMQAGVSNPATSVQHVIARNPNTPSQALVELCHRMSTPVWLLREIASHPNCPDHLLAELADDNRRRGYREFEAENVLYDVLRRDDCPEEIVQANFDHPSAVIAAAARGHHFNLPVG